MNIDLLIKSKSLFFRGDKENPFSIRKTIGAWLIVVLVFASLPYFVVKSWNQVQKVLIYRETTIVMRDAQFLMDQNKLQEAWVFLRPLVLKNPRRRDFLVMCAELLSRAEQTHAGLFIERIEELGELSVEEQKMKIRWKSLQHGEAEVVSDINSIRDKISELDKNFIMILVRYWKGLDRQGEWVEKLLNFYKSRAKTFEEQAMCLKVICASKEYQYRQKGIEELWNCARRKDQYSSQFLQILLDIEGKDPQEVKRIFKFWQELKGMTIKEECNMYEVMLKMSLMGKLELIYRCKEKMVATDEENKHYFGHMLIKLGEAHFVVQSFKELNLFKHRQLLDCFLTAATLTQDFELVKSKIVGAYEQRFIDQKDRDIYLIHFKYMTTLDKREFLIEMEDVYVKALNSQDIEMMLYLIDYAEKRGFNEFAIKGYKTIANYPQFEALALEKIMGIAKQFNDPALELEVLYRQKDRVLNDIGFDAHFMYLRILLGYELEKCREELELVKDKFADNIQYLFLYQFANWRLGAEKWNGGLFLKNDTSVLTDGQLCIAYRLGGFQSLDLKAQKRINCMKEKLEGLSELEKSFLLVGFDH